MLLTEMMQGQEYRLEVGSKAPTSLDIVSKKTKWTVGKKTFSWNRPRQFLYKYFV